MTAMTSMDLMAGQAGVRPALSGRPEKAKVLVLGTGVSGLVERLPADRAKLQFVTVATFGRHIRQRLEGLGLGAAIDVFALSRFGGLTAP